MIHFGIDSRSMGNDIKVLVTSDIDKISSPCLLLFNSSEDAWIFIFRVWAIAVYMLTLY